MKFKDLPQDIQDAINEQESDTIDPEINITEEELEEWLTDLGIVRSFPQAHAFIYGINF